MSIVLALAVVAVVVCAAPRRRRRSPSRAAVTVRSLGRHVRVAVRGTLAALAAGAVLLLFGQQASAQADETPEPPPIVQPTPDGTDGPIGDVDAPPTNDPADGGDEPGSPLAEPAVTKDPRTQAESAPPMRLRGAACGADASGAIASERCRHHAARLGHASRATHRWTRRRRRLHLPLRRLCRAAPIDPPAVAVMAPREVDLGLWNVTLRGRAWVRSNGATISIGFDGDGTELMRATADVSEHRRHRE